jgi:hypothetical protein
LTQDLAQVTCNGAVTYDGRCGVIKAPQSRTTPDLSIERTVAGKAAPGAHVERSHQGVVLLGESTEPGVHMLAKRSGTSVTLGKGKRQHIIRPWEAMRWRMS